MWRQKNFPKTETDITYHSPRPLSEYRYVVVGDDFMYFLQKAIFLSVNFHNQEIRGVPETCRSYNFKDLVPIGHLNDLI